MSLDVLHGVGPIHALTLLAVLDWLEHGLPILVGIVNYRESDDRHCAGDMVFKLSAVAFFQLHPTSVSSGGLSVTRRIMMHG